nr:hypothetical protein [uncultured Pedobacter sp.]
MELKLHCNFNNFIILANHLTNNNGSYLFNKANQIIRRFKHNDMRLISCVALLMVIPAIGLLTKANKFTDKKNPDVPVQEQVVNDSASFTLLNRDVAPSNSDHNPTVYSTDYRLSFHSSTKGGYLQLVK